MIVWSIAERIAPRIMLFTTFFACRCDDEGGPWGLSVDSTARGVDSG
jgi:hypothetical protein